VADHGHLMELQTALRGMIGNRQSFDIEEMSELVNKMLQETREPGDYYDPVTPETIKLELMQVFERGELPGYSITMKPVIGENGPFHTVQFSPTNQLDPLDLIESSSKYVKVACNIPAEYREFMIALSKRVECTQDMLLRSILIRALDLIHEDVSW
jgi:hypothetical protein